MNDIDMVGPWGWLYVILFCFVVIFIGTVTLTRP